MKSLFHPKWLLRHCMQCAVLLLLLMTAFSQMTYAQGAYSVTTVPPHYGNGQAAIGFEITALKPVRLYRFWCELDNSGTAEIWAHANGFTTANTGWVFLGQGSYNSSNPSVPTEINVTLDFPMNTNETWGFFIFTPGATNVNYRNGALPYDFANSDISINTNHYGGSGTTNPTQGTTSMSFTFSPREFCGTVYYDLAASAPYDAGISQLLQPSGFCAGSHGVQVELQNFGTAQLTSATINWSVNNVTQTPISWSGLLDSVGGAGSQTTAVTLGSYTFAANTPYTIRAWSTNPNNQPDTINYNDTLEVVVMAGLSGTMTIGGTAPDFSTFSDAVDALMQYGLCGPVTFQVAAGTYNEEIDIGVVPGASATNTVTFDGGTGNAATRVLTYSHTADGAVVMLDGADYLRFRNLTIRATGSQDGSAIWFTNDADYNIVEDCILEASTSATSADAVPVVGSGSKTSNTSSGNTGSYNYIAGNQIRGGYYGIHWQGVTNTDTLASKGNVFYDNDITDWYWYGFYSYYSNALTVENNRILPRSSATSSAYGMYIYYANTGPQIIGNLSVGEAYGLRLYYPNYAHGTYSLTEPRAKVYNNMFIAADQSTSTRYGAYVYRPQYLDFWHNNLIVNSTGSLYYGAYIYTYSGYNDVDIRNNMFATSNPSTASYLLYVRDISVVTGLDYNLYYAPAGPAAGNYFYIDGSPYNWNTLPKTTWNAHSVWGEPYFENDLNDLHSRSPSGYLAGTPIAEVSTDFDGDARHPATPCIGADEYPQPPDEYDMAVIVPQVSYAPDRWTRLEGAVNHRLKVLLENIGLVDDPQNIDVGISDMPMSTIGDALLVETFTPSWDASHRAVVEFSTPITGLTATPSATLYARAFLPGEQNPSNDQAKDTHPVHTTKVYGYEDFENFEDGQNFTYAQGYLPVPGWTTVDNNGGDAPAFLAEKYMMIGLMNPADEWLITPGAPLIGASSFRIGFDFQNYNSVPVTIEVAYGMSPVPGSMTTFATFSNIGMGSFTAQQLWQATGKAGDPYFNTLAGQDGIYYIGIHVTTGTTGYRWSLDNIKFDDNPSPPPKIAYGLPGAPIGDFIDTGSPPIQISATYKQPGLINRIYQVASSTDIYGPNGDFLWAVETNTPWLSVSMEAPDITLQGYNTTPARPRQFQTFTLSVNTSGLAPGVHYGTLVFYGILFNDDFPPPNKGLVALNEPLRVPVELRIISTGYKPGGGSLERRICPLTVAGSPYDFVDAVTMDPIATVNVTSGQITCMTIRCFPNQLPLNLARKRYVQRYWQIEYTGSGWTADITFPYADTEASMVLDPDQLRGIRQPAPLSQWEDPIIHTTSISDVLNRSVTVRDLDEFNIIGNIALAHPYLIFGRDGEGALPAEFALMQNYPNPFNPVTSVEYAVPEEQYVRIAVYNQLGMEVAVLVDGVRPAGYHTALFDATDLASGMYLCRMTAGEFVQTRTMTLSK